MKCKPGRVKTLRIYDVECSSDGDGVTAGPPRLRKIARTNPVKMLLQTWRCLLLPLATRSEKSKEREQVELLLLSVEKTPDPGGIS